MRLLLCLFLSFLYISSGFCRRHTLVLKNDARFGILCSQFAYGTQGSLFVQLSGFARDKLGSSVGFSMEKSTSNSLVTSSKQKNGKCFLSILTDKRIFSIRLEERFAKLKEHTDSSILIMSAENSKLTPFSFTDAEDEQTFKSFKPKISTFLLKYSSSGIDADYITNDIIATLLSDEELRAQVVNLIKQSGSSDMAVYETLNRLLFPGETEGEIKEENPSNNLHRNRRAPSNRILLEQAAEENKKLDRDQQDVEVDPVGGVLSGAQIQNLAETHENQVKEIDVPKMVEVKKEFPSLQSDSKNAKLSDRKNPNGAMVNVDGAPPNYVPRAGEVDENLKLNLAENGQKPPVADKAAFIEPPKPPKPSKHHMSASATSVVKEAINSFVRGDENFHYTFANGMVSLNFTVTFTSSSEVGAYDLVFHNCRNAPVDASILMVERNGDNYLSLGEQPLAMLFCVFTLIYIALSVVWGLHLRFSKAPVFRIHYLMLAMVIVKSISLMFHSINFYVIGRHGVQEEGWAVMYYIAHMTRGFLLIVTILMIGAGWTYIKHVFTRQEKQVFLVVIPLQVFANVATIVINETEQGATRFALWNEIFTVVDLLCCAGVLFPVIWSIRHLRQAAQSDGKVAQNLRKLRLFRHFYILVICYIYFTRIIVYLLRMSTPFAWTWLVELFEQSVTLVFYVSVGSKFRPFNDNPYLQIPTSDEQEMEDVVMQRFDVEEAWSQSGIADGVTRIHRPQGLNAARENRRRRDDASNLPFPGESEAADSDLLPLIRP